MDDTPTDAPGDLPCVWTLLGATLALMTAHAVPAADALMERGARQRLIARKIASNLFFLQHHPLAPSGMRPLLASLRTHWAGPPDSAERLPAAPSMPASRQQPLH